MIKKYEIIITQSIIFGKVMHNSKSIETNRINHIKIIEQNINLRIRFKRINIF